MDKLNDYKPEMKLWKGVMNKTINLGVPVALLIYEKLKTLEKLNKKNLNS